MSIQKIKIFEEDGDQKYTYSGRSIELQTTKNSYIGPNRCSTSVEFNSLINVGTQSLYIPDFISIIPKKLKKDQVLQFTQENGIHKEIANYLATRTSSARYSSIIMSPILLPKIKIMEKSNYEKFCRRSNFVQSHVRNSLGNLSSSFLNTLYISSKISINTLEETFKSMSKFNCWVPVLPIDMDKNLFKRSIDLIMETLGTYQIPIILFSYSDPLNFLENYEYIWKHRSKEIVFSMCDIPRECIRSLSGAHYLNIFGIDFVGREVRLGGGPPKDDGTAPYLKIKYFQKEDLTVKREMNLISKIDIFNDMPKDNRIDKIYKNRDMAEKNNDSIVLNSIAGLHEFFCSSKELDVVSNYIKNREYSEYIINKELLGEVIDYFNEKK